MAQANLLGRRDLHSAIHVDPRTEDHTAARIPVHTVAVIPLKLGPIRPQHSHSPDVTPQTSNPFPTRGHTAVVIPDADAQILLFGGFLLKDDGTVKEATNAVHLVTGQGQSDEMSVSLIETSGDAPSPRAEHAAALVGRVLVVLGGVDMQRGLPDGSLYFLDIGEPFRHRANHPALNTDSGQTPGTGPACSLEGHSPALCAPTVLPHTESALFCLEGFATTSHCKTCGALTSMRVSSTLPSVCSLVERHIFLNSEETPGSTMGTRFTQVGVGGGSASLCPHLRGISGNPLPVSIGSLDGPPAH